MEKDKAKTRSYSEINLKILPEIANFISLVFMKNTNNSYSVFIIKQKYLKINPFNKSCKMYFLNLPNKIQLL